MRRFITAPLIMTAAVILAAGTAAAQPTGPGEVFSELGGLPLAQWHGGYGGMGPGGGMMGWGMGGGWLGFLLMILFWGVVIAAAVAFVRWLVRSGDASRSGDGAQARPGDSAMDILRKRYARGEIDSEEFQQRKRALTED